MDKKKFDFTDKLDPKKFSELDKDFLADSFVITIVNIFDEDNQPHYLYLKISADKFQDFVTESQNNLEINFEEYGDVIEFGPGLIPTKEVKEKILKEYNFDTDVVLENQSKGLAELYKPGSEKN